ncbi:MAG TPA: PDZ domain-containing protein [Gemmatimonadaceae bacterium]|nr:PDZ domain-containing protein [Gemmatimonadaceae bacterium]
MNRKTLALGFTALLLVPAASAMGQQREAERRAERAREELEKARREAGAFGYAFAIGDRDRPRLGITTESSGLRDTLGLLVTDVTEDGPAAKAGLEEGDRIQSVNGVNLRLAREDAGEEDMEGIATRRLIRTLGKAKIGDEVELRVWHDGAVKTVRVKTVSVDELEGRPFREMSGPDRASLGIGIGSSGSRRDTLGILVSSVVDEGPAAKAGLIEGDRIQAINDVDLRVPSEDAGDWAMSSARARRLTRELEKLKPGDEVSLRVYSGGNTKTVRIKTISSRDLPNEHSFFFGDMPGRTMIFPRGQLMPSTPRAFPGVTPGVMRYRVEPQGDVRRKIEQALPKIVPALKKVRPLITI